MSILFAACEPGSCRALLPVAQCCLRAGLPVLAVGRGSMPAEAEACGLPLLPCPETSPQAEALLADHGVQVVAFSSNVSDPLPLSLARRAARRGARTLHVLDYWNGYASRMALDGLPLFQPDAYAVPDELAREAALGEGIAPGALVVSGQPALADVAQARMPDPERRRARRREAGCHPDLPLVLFVSEPASQDQGSGPENPAFRGYTEHSVLESLLAALRPLAGRVQLAALAHPREDADGLRARLDAARGGLDARLLRPARGRDALPLASGVAGMASTLLYEAWLNGLPVASIQPGLRIKALTAMKRREGVLFLDRASGLRQALEPWASGLEAHPAPRPRAEAALHAGAAERLCGMLQALHGAPQTNGTEPT